ncbi:hypothetical protein ACLB2K_007414 [Fragaria x ananassa]
MVAGGRSSDEMAVGGFRRLFSSPAALPARMVGRGEREEATGVLPGPELRSIAGGTATSFPAGGLGQGKLGEKKRERRGKKEEKGRREEKEKGFGPGQPPPAQLN